MWHKHGRKQTGLCPLCKSDMDKIEGFKYRVPKRPKTTNARVEIILTISVTC
jgi:hypothetical protein